MPPHCTQFLKMLITAFIERTFANCLQCIQKLLLLFAQSIIGHRKKVESNALKKVLSDVYKVGKSDSLVNRIFGLIK